jgi:hypothetical protein
MREPKTTDAILVAVEHAQAAPMNVYVPYAAGEDGQAAMATIGPSDPRLGSSRRQLALAGEALGLPQYSGMSPEQQRRIRFGSVDLRALTQLAARSRRVLALLSTLCLFAVG